MTLLKISSATFPVTDYDINVQLLTLKNFKLTIEYDGGSFYGWQVQPGISTIQNEIQKILRVMTRENIVIHGSGRTDAGVHALAQVANFHSKTQISPLQFQIALNQMLPKGIVITECRYVDETFHARFSVIRKTYRYRILNRPLAMAVGRQYLWHIRHDLDLDAMQQAANLLIGEHNFKAFEGSGSPRASTVRRIDSALFTRDGDLIVFEISANGFLKFMVRNIVGTLVDVGKAKYTVDEFKTILISKDRQKGGATAPPQGLFLLNVEYPEH